MKTWIKEHEYCFALLYFVFYLGAFYLLERFSAPKYTIHCFLDDKIPFCEFFIVPYFSWFIVLAGALGYYMFKSKEDFQNLCFLMFVGMTFCITVYVILPNGLNLRAPIPRDNFFCKWVELLYRIDTPTNVCPSIHVSSTVAIYEVTKHSKLFKRKKRVVIVMAMIAWLICLSTVFLKQHSVVDVILGYLLSKILGKVTYSINWRNWMAHTHLKRLL